MAGTRGWIWDTPAFAANVLGGLALGAVSTGVGVYPYYGGCYGYGSCGYPAAYGYATGPILRRPKPGL